MQIIFYDKIFLMRQHFLRMLKQYNKLIQILTFVDFGYLLDLKKKQ